MCFSTIYLVTGANRPHGIGFGIVAHILATHEDSIVYAGRLKVIKCISGDIEGNSALAKEIEERRGRVDTVIANAAIWNTFAHINCVAVADMQEHFHVNVMGPIVLFQTMYSLLRKSANPKFVPISSIGGCLGGENLIVSPVGGVCYGATKAALNWATRKIHFENDWVGVATDLLSDTSDNDPTGVFKTFLSGNEPTAAEAAASIIKVIDESTREKNGGKFMHLDGTTLP